MPSTGGQQGIHVAAADVLGVTARPATSRADRAGMSSMRLIQGSALACIGVFVAVVIA
jgi:hypothetical protein